LQQQTNCGLRQMLPDFRQVPAGFRASVHGHHSSPSSQLARLRDVLFSVERVGGNRDDWKRSPRAVAHKRLARLTRLISIKA
jgi:hypothetical protein